MKRFTRLPARQVLAAAALLIVTASALFGCTKPQDPAGPAAEGVSAGETSAVTTDTGETEAVTTAETPAAVPEETDPAGSEEAAPGTTSQNSGANQPAESRQEPASASRPETQATSRPAASTDSPPASTTRPAASSKPVTTAPSASSSPSTQDSYAEQVLAIVNRERAGNGLSPLTMNSRAVAAAEVRAKEITASFSHTRPSGASCFTALDESGARYTLSGENIARGYRTPEAVMAGWMASPGHAANILNGSFTEIGIACYVSGGETFWVQLFLTP